MNSENAFDPEIGEWIVELGERHSNAALEAYRLEQVESRTFKFLPNAEAVANAWYKAKLKTLPEAEATQINHEYSKKSRAMDKALADHAQVKEAREKLAADMKKGQEVAVEACSFKYSEEENRVVRVFPRSPKERAEIVIQEMETLNAETNQTLAVVLYCMDALLPPKHPFHVAASELLTSLRGEPPRNNVTNARQASTPSMT